MLAISTMLMLAYVAVLVWLAARDRRQTSLGYMIAERRVGAFATMASVAGNLRDGAGLAAWVVLGSYYGFGALWLTAGLCVGLALLALLAPRVRTIAEKADYISANQLIADGIGPHSARAATWIISITALLYAAAQVYVAGRLFSSVVHVPPLWGIVTVAGIVGMYLYLGGYYTTIRTGVVQWCIIMLIVLLPWLVSAGKEVSVPLTTLATVDFRTATAFAGIALLVTFSSADLWQLMFSASSPRSAQLGFASTIPVYTVICVGLVYFAHAVTASVPSGVPPNDALFALFASSQVPPVILAIVGMFVVAAIMSTLDSQVFLFVSTVVRAIQPASVEAANPKMEANSRLLLLVTMVVLVIVASTIGNIIEFLFGAVTLGTILAPVLLLALLRSREARRSADVAICGTLLVAAGVYAWLFWSGAFKDLMFTLVPASIALLGCVGLSVSEFSRRKRSEDSRAV